MPKSDDRGGGTLHIYGATLYVQSHLNRSLMCISLGDQHALGAMALLSFGSCLIQCLPVVAVVVVVNKGRMNLNFHNGGFEFAS